MAERSLESVKQAFADAQSLHANALSRSERKLEAARNQHRDRIRLSEEKLAALENQLEMLECFEQERRARDVRMELAAAITQHKQEVDGADWALRAAMRDYIAEQVAAAVAMQHYFAHALAYRE